MLKSGLLNEYKAFQADIDAVIEKANSLKADTTLSEEGKEQALDAFISSKDIQGKSEHLAASIQDIIDSLEVAWAANCIARLEDKSYQDTLIAAADAIEGGYLSAPYDLEAVAMNFAGDTVALARLNDAAQKKGITVLGFSPTDTRERQLGNLQNMVANVKTITPHSVKRDSITASMHLHGNIEYLENHVDDSFNYVGHGVNNG